MSLTTLKSDNCSSTKEIQVSGVIHIFKMWVLVSRTDMESESLSSSSSPPSLMTLPAMLQEIIYFRKSILTNIEICQIGHQHYSIHIIVAFS